MSDSDDDCDEKGKSGPAIYIMYVMSGLMAVLAVLLLGLFVTSCGGKESDPKLTGTLSKEEALKQASWGPYNMLFPRVWIKIWFGYFLMLLFTALVIPAITPSLGLTSQAACESGAPSPGPWIEAVISSTAAATRGAPRKLRSLGLEHGRGRALAAPHERE